MADLNPLPEPNRCCSTHSVPDKPQTLFLNRIKQAYPYFSDYDQILFSKESKLVFNGKIFWSFDAILFSCYQRTLTPTYLTIILKIINKQTLPLIFFSQEPLQLLLLQLLRLHKLIATNERE